MTTFKFIIIINQSFSLPVKIKIWYGRVQIVSTRTWIWVWFRESGWFGDCTTRFTMFLDIVIAYSCFVLRNEVCSLGSANQISAWLTFIFVSFLCKSFLWIISTNSRIFIKIFNAFWFGKCVLQRLFCTDIILPWSWILNHLILLIKRSLSERYFISIISICDWFSHRSVLY